MVKTRRKITALRVLQILFYALGFPLFIHLVMLAAKPLSESNLVTGINGKLAIIVAAVMWVVVILVQLLMRAVCRKNRMTRAVIVALVAAVITLAPIVYCDLVLQSKYDKDVKAEQEEDESFWADSYKVQITKFREYVDATNWEINEFLSVYNIEFYGKNYNMGGKNTDGSEVTYDEEKDVWLSPNGMYADGYRFGYYSAKEVLTNYYTNKYAYEAEGKDIDAVLDAVLVELNTNPVSDWNKYKSGAPESSFAKEDFEYIASSTEYMDAYGPEGTATKYYLTEDRLNEIMSVVGANFGSSDAVVRLLNALKGLSGTLSGVLGPDVADVLNQLGSLPEILNSSLTVDKLLTFVNGVTIGGKNLGAVLCGLLGEEGATELNKEMLFDLLVNYSYYQAPTAYPVYYFIEDDALREYAYAKYYATVHGAKIGSVLVSDNGMVGKITMSSGGTINPYSGYTLLSKFQKWDFDKKLQNEYYPFFAVRAIALKMSAAIVFVLLAAYFFTGHIDKQYAKLTLKQ